MEGEGQVGLGADDTIPMPQPATLVDGVLADIMQRHGDKMVHLPRAQQGLVASMVAAAREKLTEGVEAMLREKAEGAAAAAASGGAGGGGELEVTANDVHGMLANVGQELEQIKGDLQAELQGPAPF